MKKSLMALLMVLSASAMAIETDGIFQCSTNMPSSSGSLTYQNGNLQIVRNTSQQTYQHNSCLITLQAGERIIQGSCSAIDQALAASDGYTFITLNEQKSENGVVVATFPALSQFPSKYGYAILNKSIGGHVLKGFTNFGGAVSLERGTSTLTGTIEMAIDGALTPVSFNCSMLI